MSDLDLEEFPIVKAETLHTPNSILLYGPPGKGKSVMAGSIAKVPGFERVLAVDTEGSAVALGPHHPEVDVIKAPTAELFTKYINALLNGKLVEPKSGLPYQAVIIDTFDKAQERQLEVFDKSKEGQATNSAGKKDSYYKWGAIKTWTSKVADLLHQADFLVIWVMHEDVDKNEDTGRTTTTVMLGGKSQQIFPSVPDIVGYFNVVKIDKEDVRAVDFRPNAKLISKQRFAGKLNGIVKDPDFSTIFKAIEPGRWDKEE